MLTQILMALIKYKAFVVAALLTLVLASMVLSRIAILKNGAEIVLLTRPIDPRDLFRGHYTIMNYTIHRIDPCKVDISTSFNQGQMVFVQLEEGQNGYWDAVSVSDKPLVSTKTTIVLSGYVKRRFKYSNTPVRKHNDRCYPGLYVRYGLEKYFAPKKRAQEIEKIRTSLANPELNRKIVALRKKIRGYRDDLNLILELKRTVEKGRIKDPLKDPLVEKLRAKIRKVQAEISKIREQSRGKVGVIVKVSERGEGAISGLQINDKKVYDEPVW